MDDDTLSILGYHHAGGDKQDKLEGIVFFLENLTGCNHQTFYVLRNIAWKNLSFLAESGLFLWRIGQNGTVRATFLNSDISILGFQNYTIIVRTTPTYQSRGGMVPVSFVGVRDEMKTPH